MKCEVMRQVVISLVTYSHVVPIDVRKEHLRNMPASLLVTVSNNRELLEQTSGNDTIWSAFEFLRRLIEELSLLHS
jgi:hypothetical protein